jgi:hypothetical protein
MKAARIPLAIKVPAVVLAFMAMVAVFVSERVLSRLASAQTHHLEDLAAVHLDGLATALIDRSSATTRGRCSMSLIGPGRVMPG